MTGRAGRRRGGRAYGFPPETAWLIERGQSMRQVPTVWWAGVDRWGLMWADRWTEDAFEAIRFPTREDAEAEIDRRGRRSRDRFGVAVEHGFITADAGGLDVDRLARALHNSDVGGCASVDSLGERRAEPHSLDYDDAQKLAREYAALRDKA